MSEWPDRLDVGPIREWPGDLTPASQRQRSPFKVAGEGYQRKSTPLSSTLEVLERELRMLGAKEKEMLVAIAPQDFRLDGKPRAQARAEHPGVILSASTKHGQLSYAVDRFTTWQDNLRAIALGLEALRKVDRYGMTRHGEQYRGFLAIESTAVPADPFSDADGAFEWLVRTFSDSRPYESTPAAIVRVGQRESHPDRGGDAEQFRLVMKAAELLRSEGLL